VRPVMGPAVIAPDLGQRVAAKRHGFSSPALAAVVNSFRRVCASPLALRMPSLPGGCRSSAWRPFQSALIVSVAAFPDDARNGTRSAGDEDRCPGREAHTFGVKSTVVLVFDDVAVPDEQAGAVVVGLGP
jgi:hypothetical protein